MGLLNFFHNQLAGVIEWKNQQPGNLFYKFPSDNDEIKDSSKLIVGPGQGCILVYEGRVVETYTEEGLFQLATDNHPFITTLRKLAQQGVSEHKLRIYFFRTAEVVNQPWGTASPVKYMDPVYQFPVELGVNGNYSFKISQPAAFFTDIVGSKDSYTTDEARQLLQSRLPQTLISHLAEARLSYQLLDAQLDHLSKGLQDKLNTAFTALGLTLTDFRIQGTLFDNNTRQRINAIADMSAQSQAAAQGGMSYADMERLKALRDVSRNEGGLAGAGLQMGVGLDLGKSLAAAQPAAGQPGASGQPGAAQPAAGQPGTTPTDAGSAATDEAMNHLRKLKTLLDEGIISQAEFEEKKKEWMGRL